MKDSWDGRERRKVNTEERDLLIRIDTNLTNHIEVMSKHMRDDEAKFSKIEDNQDFQKKIIYGGIGIIIFVEFMMKLIK